MTMFAPRFAVLVGIVVATGCAVGCAAVEPNDRTGDESVLADFAVTANDWQHQPLDLSCTAAASNAFTKQSRRHFYSFAGQEAAATRFSLQGSWPNSWGSVLIVADLNADIVGFAYDLGSHAVELDVTFPTTDKYFVFAAPFRYTKVNSPRAYDLEATCTSCAEYVTSDGRKYAKNFPPGEDLAANEWVVTDPFVQMSGVNPGTCVEHNAKECPDEGAPVCGTPIVTDVRSTYPSLCEFEKVVREAAGAAGESKGAFSAGECSPVHCASLESNGVYYVQNVASQADADAWAAAFPDATDVLLDDLACGEPRACIELYNPVCGTIGAAEPQTFSNSCFFAAAVKASAGSELGGSSKGYANPGACELSCPDEDPSKNYISLDPGQCAAMQFLCIEGTTPFFDECGCGCQTMTCPDPNPAKNYLVNDPVTCTMVKFGCANGYAPFFDSCGCGCMSE